MPKAWSAKDERMYEHVKVSELESGKPEEVAERIAAATVNQERSSEGRTKEKQSKAEQEQSQRDQAEASSRAAKGKGNPNFTASGKEKSSS